MTDRLERGAALRRFRRHRLGTFGLVGLVALVVGVLFGPYVLPHEANDLHLDAIHTAPNGTFWLGTDALGRDLTSRALVAGRISLLVGLAAMGGALCIGSAMGLLAGLAGGRIDNLVMRAVDVMLSVPSFFVLLVLSTFFKGYGLSTIVVIIALTSWMPVARLTRAVALQLRGQQMFEAARCGGLPWRRIVMHHVLPNSAAPLVVIFTLGLGEAILTESALSFLGFGLQPPTPSWGYMLTDAQQAMLDAPWVAIVPGAFIFLTVLCINFVGDALRDAMNPKESVVG